MGLPSKDQEILISLGVLGNIAKAHGFDPENLQLEQLNVLIEVCRQFRNCGKDSEVLMTPTSAYHIEDGIHLKPRAEFASYLRALADKFDP